MTNARTIDDIPAIHNDSTKRFVSLLRLIVRAIDLHSRSLVKNIGLTIPQLLVLQEIKSHTTITPTEVAMNIKLSKATISGIIKRLRQKRYINHHRNEFDLRRVYLTLTAKGEKILAQNPLAIQQQFIQNFAGLSDAEQRVVLNSFEIVATLMFDSCSAANDFKQWTANRRIHDGTMH